MIPLKAFQRVILILSVALIAENLCEKVGDFQMRRVAYFTAVAEHTLLDHVTATHVVNSQADCSRACLSDFRCRSYNYRHTRTPENTCELNDAVREEYPNNFVESRSYSYYESFAIHNWLKINTKEVCFGAKNKDYGLVVIPIGGPVAAFRLEHLHGYVTCDTLGGKVAQSNWGCGTYFNYLMVFITSSHNQVIAPHNPTWFGNIGHAYSLYGLNTFSPNVFLETSPEYKVEKGEQLRVWYGEDLKDHTTENNGGRVCVNVYAFFTNGL